MSSKAISYAFKLIGVMVLSLILWNVFIGVPTSNAAVGDTSTVTVNSYYMRGSLFEDLAYGTSRGGFKHELGETWLQMTGVNGLQTELRTKDQWAVCANSVRGTNKASASWTN